MAGVFISYRRSDSAGHTGRLASDLAEGLEEQQLFRDIEAIEAGEDFVDALQRAVSACSVMLVIIGPNWATAHTSDGKRRLKEPGDFVRMEIEAALKGTVRVIPVLVGDAQMPQADDLPESMHALLRKNAFMISDRRWQYDVDQLLNVLEKIPGIASRRETQSGAQPVAEAPPPAKGRTPVVKLAIGAVVVVVATIMALAIVGSGDDAPVTGTASTASASADPADVSRASALPPPASTSPEHARFDGLWRTEDNQYFHISVAPDGVTVVGGTSMDPAHAIETKEATAAGMELVGKGTFLEGVLDATLTDAFSRTTDTITLSLSADGQSLEGTLVRNGQEPLAITLRRV
jgi:hypothetical protein